MDRDSVFLGCCMALSVAMETASFFVREPALPAVETLLDL